MFAPKNRIPLIFVALAHYPAIAHAYIGPGVGLGGIVTFAALVLGLILLIVGFLWYPLKRRLRKRRQAEGRGQRHHSLEKEG